MESMKEEYLRFWKGILGVMLGWTSEQVEQWAHKWDPHGIDDEDSMFYHEQPSWYVANLLIPDHIAEERNTPRYWRLDREVEHVLNFSEANEPVIANIDAYDYEAAKQRIDAVLKKYEDELRNR